MKGNSKTQALVPEERVAQAIFVLRGQKVMLDSDLAKLYGVSTRALNQAVMRNLTRFPKDFMFPFSASEFKNLRLQFVTSSWGGRRTLPYAFTEHGVAMLSSVLKSERAILVNVAVIRAFVKLRQLLSTNKDLKHKLEEHDRVLYSHDKNIRELASAIKCMIDKPEPKRNPIGFGLAKKYNKKQKR
ncbi:MAG TPA: ORF6N domain-containing protein [Candidatus Paceibacterota bacterium]